MKRKKFISVSASILVLLSMLTACSQSESAAQPEVTTPAPSTMAPEQQSKAEEISVKEFELENKQVVFLSEWPRNPADGKAKDIAIELFQTRFGGEVVDKIVGHDERFDQLSTLVLSGSSPDFFSAADMDAFPRGVINNLFQSVDNYIDFNDDWWKDVKDINDSFLYKGKHYVTALSTEVEVIMLYNKAIMMQNGFKDPAELLKEGKWDWDACLNMMSEFCSKSDDNYGIDSWWVSRGFCDSTGVPLIGMENGKVVNNLNDPLIATAQEILANLNKENYAYPVWEHGWVSSPSDIKKGTTLFYPVGIWALMDLNSEYGMASYAENMNDLGFVPFPKCPTTEEYFIPARISGYLLCSGAPNPEGFACLAYCERAGANSAEAKQIAKEQYFNEYGWTEDMWDMFNEIYDMAKAHPVFNFMGGVSTDVAKILDDSSKSAYHSGASWTQVSNEIYNGVQAEIDALNAEME